jgi:hypothetical protein
MEVFSNDDCGLLNVPEIWARGDMAAEAATPRQILRGTISRALPEFIRESF